MNVTYDVEYSYYANGWLYKVTNALPTTPVDIATYRYDGVGNRTNVALANGTSTAYAYDTSDPRYGLNTITDTLGTTTLATIDYTSTPRDYAGNPKSMTDWTGTWNYTYDANNRLASATPPSPVPSQPAGGGYGYDWVGNRLNPPSGANHMQYNSADQLVSWPGMHGTTSVAGYAYDGSGNLTSVTDASGIYHRGKLYLYACRSSGYRKLRWQNSQQHLGC